MKRMTLFLLCLCLLLSACTVPVTDPGTVFYYPRSETESLSEPFASESRDIPRYTEMTKLLALYCGGPVTSGLENTLPPDTTVLSWDLHDGKLWLNFDSSLAQLSGIELTVAAACLSKTFLERLDAHTLVLTAQGALLNGETALQLSTQDLNLQDDTQERLQQSFTVYYTTADRRYLIGEEVSVQVAPAEELPMQLLELLLTPPDGSELHSALPAGTRFRSVTIEDGLCTVDLSQQFDSRRYFSLPAQCLSLLSMVNTLTGLEQIQRVEFTVEENLLIRYGALSIDAPLVRDERCIGPVRTGLGEQDREIYLAHSSEELLVPIPSRIRQSTNQTLPEQLIRCLLQDPGSNGVRSWIPEGTRLNGISVTGGTCYVDVSSHYLSDPAHLRSAGRVIAATLCLLEEIDRVQILVDGAIPQGFDSALFGNLTPTPDWFL